MLKRLFDLPPENLPGEPDNIEKHEQETSQQKANVYYRRVTGLHHCVTAGERRPAALSM